jgi:hypothetical protein
VRVPPALGVGLHWPETLPADSAAFLSTVHHLDAIHQSGLRVVRINLTAAQRDRLKELTGQDDTYLGYPVVTRRKD